LKFIHKIQIRNREIQKLHSPIKIFFFIVSSVLGVIAMAQRVGFIFYTGAGLVALAFLILYTVPINSARLFEKRLFAFLIDLTLLGLTTITIVGLLYQTRVLRPCAVVSLGILWTWFLLFVLSDWSFGTTPGQRLLGLRLRTTNGDRVSFQRCLLRELLLLIIPVILLYPLQLTLITRPFAMWSAEFAVLALFPLSIAFIGGQSLPDLVLKTAVLPSRSPADDNSSTVPWLNWMLLAIAVTIVGLLFAFAITTETKFMFLEKVAPPPAMIVQIQGEDEATLAAGLWRFLYGQSPEMGFDLQDISVVSIIHELPPITTELPTSAACSDLLATTESYRIVRAQISPQSAALSELMLIENFTQFFELDNKPTVAVFELSKRETYGLFNLDRSEDYFFCRTSSDEKPKNPLLGYNSSLSINGSMDRSAFLLVGRLDLYSTIEKVPIWLH
jgi:uncharacterized RDD family membrane protein YckC